MKENFPQPFVSICVPVYNGDKYLKECLESIHKQSYRHWECVVNNNCSTDKSLTIANEYADKDKRFKVYTNNEFISLVDNWNQAFLNSNKEAKYFKMVQADDWIYPEYIERMVEVFEKNENVGLCTSFRIDNLNVLPRGYNVYNDPVFSGRDALYDQLTKKIDYMGSITTIMYRMGCLKELSRFPKIFDETSYHIDMELDYDILRIADIGFVPQILSYTRRHEESGTSTVVKKLHTIYQHDELVYHKYLDIFPQLNKQYKKIRLKYAAFHISNILLNRKKAIQWHKKYLVRPFTLREYLIGIILYNRLSVLLKKIQNKFSNLLKN
jgi:glycosyltransferase involved in cell wall biosynthesis